MLTNQDIGEYLTSIVREHPHSTDLINRIKQRYKRDNEQFNIIYKAFKFNNVKECIDFKTKSFYFNNQQFTANNMILKFFCWPDEELGTFRPAHNITNCLKTCINPRHRNDYTYVPKIKKITRHIKENFEFIQETNYSNSSVLIITNQNQNQYDKIVQIDKERKHGFLKIDREFIPITKNAFKDLKFVEKLIKSKIYTQILDILGINLKNYKTNSEIAYSKVVLGIKENLIINR